MHRLLPVLFLSIINIALFAQGSGEFLISENQKNLIITNYTVDNGLVSNSIRKIARSKNGYLLIATYNGISTFDGKFFTNFNTGNEPSLKSNNIYDFCTDSANRFWFGTHDGIIVYDGKDFSVPEGFTNIENMSVQHLQFDKRGVLWIGTTSNGLYKYFNKQLHKVTEVKIFDKTIISLIFTDETGNVWIGTEKGDLYKFDGNKFVKIQGSENTNGIFAACQGKQGEYYFGTRKGLYTLRNNSLILINENINFINDLRFDNEGRLWIASNAGLFYYLKDKGQLNPLKNRIELSGQIIQTIYFDKEGIIWAGTFRKGLLQCRLGCFENFPFSDIGVDQVPSGTIQLNDSIFLICTDEGDIFALMNNSIRKLKFKKIDGGKRIKSLFTDSHQNIWICSYNGLIKVSGQGMDTKHELLDLPDKTIRNIVETEDGYYWIGTRQSGIYKISRDLNVLKSINTGNHLSSNFVMSLIKGRNGKIYVATKSGFDVLRNDSIIGHYDMKNGLPDDLVFNIYEDNNGVLWIATIKGLSRFENGVFTSFDTRNGLSDDKIFDVTEDDFGYLWMPVTYGIIRVKKSELNAGISYKDQKFNFVLYDQTDGMHNAQYVSASKLLKTRDGKIVINTHSGISILDPLIVNSTYSKPILLFSRISSESSTRLISEDYYKFGSSTRFIQIDFSYIDFFTPDKVKFRYILEPFDEAWQTTDNYRFARYTNLPPGDYTFKVQAISKSKEGILLEKELKFSILPAFYETVWFRFLAALIIVLLIWFMYVLRVKTIKHQKEVLENVVMERTREINRQKEAIEKNIIDLEKQKAEIADKNEEILITGNKIEQAYLNLKLLSDLGQEITSYLSEDEIVMTVYQEICSLMDSDIVSIGNYVREEELVRFNATIYKGKKAKPTERSIHEKNCILCFALLNNIDLITNNIQNDYPEFIKTFPDISSFKSITSVMVLPIRIKGEIIGIFTVQSFRKDSYSDYHFNLLKNLVIYVGIAIENSKTYIKIKEQKEELEKVNASKDRMFSIIGHDLRGPVGTIKSFLDIIIENPELANTENTIEILKTMQQSLGSAYTLLDNLLLWARSQRGQLEFEPRPFQIKQSIDEIVGLVSETSRNKEIEIGTQINYNEPVFADQNMITTVLRNLVSNAIKFTPRGGKVMIVSDKYHQNSNGKTEDKIEIKVIDNGIGISNSDIDKILEINELFSTPGTEKESGSGLGIGICIEFLSRHKQKLYVTRNEETGGIYKTGTTFKFYLNRSQENLE